MLTRSNIQEKISMLFYILDKDKKNYLDSKEII